MENTLQIKRVQISFDEKEADWLKRNSDQKGAEGTIFSVLTGSFEKLNALLNELQENLGIAESFAEAVRAEYPEEFFRDHSLVVMFSDERSGSSTITLKESVLFSDTLCLTLERKRGLTMDMAYLFLFCPYEGKDAVRSRVRIEEEAYTW